MTTWSDVVEQKQADKGKGNTSYIEVQSVSEMQSSPRKQQTPENRVEDVSFHYDSHLIALQNDFAQQQQKLQEQYASQVRQNLIYLREQ